MYMNIIWLILIINRIQHYVVWFIYSTYLLDLAAFVQIIIFHLVINVQSLYHAGLITA